MGDPYGIRFTICDNPKLIIELGLPLERIRRKWQVIVPQPNILFSGK